LAIITAKASEGPAIFSVDSVRAIFLGLALSSDSLSASRSAFLLRPRPGLRGEPSASELEGLSLIGLSVGLGVKGHAIIVPGVSGEVSLGLVWVNILGNGKRRTVPLGLDTYP